MDAAAVLIIGAGPTGLTLACDLRSRGVDAQVIDNAAGPATTSRALGLQPRGREILGRLGALGDLPDRAVHAYTTNILLRQRLLTRFVVETQSGRVNLGPLLISQAEIEAQLRRRLGELGGDVRWSHELIGATQDADGVDVVVRTAEGERAIRAGWLIGCDGAHSVARKLMGVQFEGRPFPETIALADVKLDWDHTEDEGTMWLHPDGIFGVVPLPGDVWRIFAELRPDDPMAAAGHGALTAVTSGSSASPEVVDRVQTLMRERAGDMTSRITSASWTSVFRFHRRLASVYRGGRMLLAGDAAHIHSALGGQGMNTGIGDAFNLGWKLACTIDGQASDRLVDTYEAERRPVAADVVKETSFAWNILLGRTGFDQLVRDHVFLPIMRRPAMQRWWIATGSQLRVSYRGGPLADAPVGSRISSFVTRSPIEGDRGPDASCRLWTTGEPTSLGHQAGAQWALLLFDGAEAEQRICADAVRSRLDRDVWVIRILSAGHEPRSGEVGEWADAVVEDDRDALTRAYRPRRQTAILLRPDGHIAWRSSKLASAGMISWLSRALDGQATLPTNQRIRDKRRESVTA
jgi:4,5-epoxidase